ncbi:MAG: aldo/keto reductase [Kiritimatiellaeota bacterium]|nr:aldo/keto reductase [Kiritimatiellota bacterium]
MSRIKRITLRNTDLEIGNLCLGGGGFAPSNKEQTFALLDAFMEAGGNFVDTAACYGRWNPDGLNCSEILIGEWLKSRNARGKMIIATKGGHYAFKTPQVSRVTAPEIRKDIEDSLAALGLDHLDFYWLHRDNEAVPVGEIIDAMEAFVKEGKIRWYGASNYRLERMEAAVRHARENNVQGFSAVSNRWSLASPNEEELAKGDPTCYHMTDAFYDWHCRSKMPAIPYSSTGGGFYEKLFLDKTGKLKLYEYLQKLYLNDRNLGIYEKLVDLRGSRAVSLYTLSLAWFLNQPFDVIPISSVKTVEQLNDFIRASELEPDEALGKIAHG